MVRVSAGDLRNRNAPCGRHLSPRNATRPPASEFFGPRPAGFRYTSPVRYHVGDDGNWSRKWRNTASALAPALLCSCCSCCSTSANRKRSSAEPSTSRFKTPICQRGKRRRVACARNNTHATIIPIPIPLRLHTVSNNSLIVDSFVDNGIFDRIRVNHDSV